MAMLFKDIYELFIGELVLPSDDDYMSFVVRLGLGYGLYERFCGRSCRSEQIKGWYSQYNVQEYIKGCYIDGDLWYRLMGSSISYGKMASLLYREDSSYIDDLFSSMCFEYGYGNPYYERGGFMAYIRSWLDANESKWLVEV